MNKPVKKSNFIFVFLSGLQFNRFGVTRTLTRKSAFDGLLDRELESEIEERGMTDEVYFSTKVTREDWMETVDGLRRNEIYPHPADQCSEICRRRGN